MAEEQNQLQQGYIIDFITDIETTEIQNAEKFICVYIDNLVKKFRYYNFDKFFISISGLKGFVPNDNKTLLLLFHKLNEYDFIINFSGSEKHISMLNIICENDTKKETYNYVYQIQNLPAIIELSSKTNIPTAGIIIMKIVSQTIIKSKILYKALVFDLDDTLWAGTLAEVGSEKIIENMKSDSSAPFIAFMNFIKVLANELGIFIAICSRNDSDSVKSVISKMDESIFPLKNQIDCIIANYNDKSENLKEIAKQLSILPQAMIFIDDNQIIRDEVNAIIPEVFVPQWNNHSDLTTQLIVGCFFERNELSLNSQERRRQFKILETERKGNNLPELLIKAINDENHIEAKGLYAKSNQFKLSQLNTNFDNFAQSLYFEIYRPNGETLGICSAITFYKHDRECFVYNWAISCRYFKIGLEEYIISYIKKTTDTDKLILCYQQSDLNNMVGELFEKYPNIFKYNNGNIEVKFTQEIIEEFNIKTNLKAI